MPSDGGIRAGRAYLELSLNDENLQKGLKSAGRRITAVGTSITKVGGAIAGIGAAAAGPIAAMAREFASFGDNIQKAAIRTGIGTKALSELTFAAQQSGTDIASLERGIKGMQRQILDLSQGSSTAVKTFEELGVSLEDIAGKSTEQQFTILADAISRVENDSQRAALSMRVYGKAGSDLLPLMADGAKGIEAMREEAEQLEDAHETEGPKHSQASCPTHDHLYDGVGDEDSVEDIHGVGYIVLKSQAI